MKLATEPYPFQWKCVRKIDKFNGRALIADDMGLGKSFESLLWASTVPEARPITVVCQSGLVHNWAREAGSHFHMRAEILEGQTLPKARDAFHQERQLYICGYSVLDWKLDFLREHVKPKIVIVDECKNINSMDTQAYLGVRDLCRGVPYVLCLDGTPATNKPVEMFPVLNLLRPDIPEFGEFFTFTTKFCNRERKPWGLVYEGGRNLDQLKSLLYDHVMIRRLTEDVLPELPPKTRHVVSIDLDDKAWEEYVAAETDLIEWLRKTSPDRAVKAARAEKLVRMGYLLRLVAKLKLPYVINWVDSVIHQEREKLILFGLQTEIIRPIFDAFHRESVFINGSVRGANRQAAVDQFQNSKQTRLCVANLKAASSGWNGTAARHVASCELWWNAATHDQGEKRAHRIGQHYPVKAHYLVARGTVEEKLCKLIQKKNRLLRAMLDSDEVEEDFDLVEQLEKELINAQG